MPIFDLFSKRQKRVRGDVPDVFQYETLPAQFKAQVVHILTDLLGNPRREFSQTDSIFESVHATLCREYGQFRLSNTYHGFREWQPAVFDFLLNRAETEQALDVIEVSFRLASYFADKMEFLSFSDPKMTPPQATTELNERFREHGIGYQLESGEIIRVDSLVLHAEAVKPTLQLLGGKRFSGANEEFLKAHEHYRHGRNAECLNECLKALESVLKIICDKQRWQYKDNDTAKGLLDLVFSKGLIAGWLQSEFASLRAILESGVPTVRNRLAGHGQGSDPRVVPAYVAAYLIHLTASSILFLVDAEKELKR